MNRFESAPEPAPLVFPLYLLADEEGEPILAVFRGLHDDEQLEDDDAESNGIVVYYCDSQLDPLTVQEGDEPSSDDTQACLLQFRSAAELIPMLEALPENIHLVLYTASSPSGRARFGPGHHPVVLETLDGFLGRLRTARSRDDNAGLN
jgi:hypothetical protein